MKPTITPQRLYNNADMTQVRELGFLQGTYRLITLLEDAKANEVENGCDYQLIKAQMDAIEFWRGIAEMVTKHD